MSKIDAETRQKDRRASEFSMTERSCVTLNSFQGLMIGFWDKFRMTGQRGK
jgi:hypothetical protein